MISMTSRSTFPFAVLDLQDSPTKGKASLYDQARSIGRDVVWLRRVVLRQAEEARRELAPLCQAAIRESKIAKGVNRALEAIRLGDWQPLNLEQNLAIVEEKDGSLLSDRAVERYWPLVLETTNRPPPRVLLTTPHSLQIPITPDDLVERLELMASIDDLLDWVLESHDDVDLNLAVQLFHSVLERCPNRTQHTDERLDYARGDLVVNAVRWIWKGREDDTRDSAPDTRRPSSKARQRVQIT